MKTGFSAFNNVVLILAMLCFFGQVGHCISFRTNDAIAIPSTEVLNDDLAVAGSSISIAGKTIGELFAAGSNISVTGETTNSAMLVGSQVSSSGPVGGSLRIAGGTVTANSVIGKDLMICAGTAIVGSEAKIARDLAAVSGTLSLPAPVGRNVYVGGGDVQISSTVGGNAWVSAESLTLLPGAVINGDLHFRGTRLDIKPGASVKGKVIKLQPAKEKQKTRGFNLIWTILSTIALVAFGTVLTAIFPKFVKAAGQHIASDFGPCIGWGALTAIIGIFVVVTAIILTFTIVLAPITLSFLSIYWIIVYAAFVVAGAAAGGAILIRAGKSVMVEMLLGTAIIGIAVNIPFIGWLIWLAAAFTGLGAMVMYVRKRNAPKSETQEPEPPSKSAAPDIEI